MRNVKNFERDEGATISYHQQPNRKRSKSKQRSGIGGPTTTDDSCIGKGFFILSMLH